MANSISGALGSTGAGATVTAYTYPGGVSAGSATADGSGNYTISSLANGDYTVTPTKPGCIFIPGSPLVYGLKYYQPSGAVINSSDVTGVNFTTGATTIGTTARADGNAGTPVSFITTGTAWSSAPTEIIVVLTGGESPATGISDLLGNDYVADGNGVFHCLSSKGNGSGGAGSNKITVTWGTSATYRFLISAGIANSPQGNFKFLSWQTETRTVDAVDVDTDPFNTFVTNAFAIMEGSINGGNAAASGRGGLALDKYFGTYANSGHAFFSSKQTNTTVGMHFGVGATHPLYETAAVFGWFVSAVKGNCGVAGATVSFSGPRSGSVTADIQGNYSIPFSAPGDVATWTITPTKIGITFSPSSDTVTVSSLDSDATGPSFTASLVTGPTSVSYTATESTIVATWTTSGGSDSNIFAGAKPGLDNGIPADESSHTAIVTGLLPSTVYSCHVSSLGSSSTPINVTTAPAPARFYLSGATVGSVTQSPGSGDTPNDFVSSDGKEYMQSSDGTGISATGYNGDFGLSTIDNLTAMTGTALPGLSNFGPNSGGDGNDSPTGGVSQQRALGLFGMAGNLFLFSYRTPADYSSIYRPSIFKSADHAQTWNTWQNPTIYNANGTRPSPYLAYEFGNTTNTGLATPVRYGVDDGTLGYLTAGNAIDGGNGYVYATFGVASTRTLMRVQRRALNVQIGTAFQFWTGPASPTPADFVDDANWSTSFASTTAIAEFTAWPRITFVPRLNSYLLTDFIYSDSGGENFQFYSGPTPAGPWTKFYDAAQSVDSRGPCPLHSDIAANTAAQNLSIRILLGGSPTSGHNAPEIAPVTWTTSAYPISGNAGVGGATVSYSGTASGSVMADALGYYTIPDLADGNYTITPSKTGYTFSPTSASETVSGADITGVNFTATLVTYSISGNAGAFLGSVSETSDSGLGGAYIGRVCIISAPPAGSQNPYLGKILPVVAAPANSTDPVLGEVVVVDEAPAGNDPYLGQVTEG